MDRAGTASCQPIPEDIGFTDEDGKTYPLAPRTEGGRQAARFETRRIIMPVATEVAGRLSAKLGGKAVRHTSRPR